jgi:hypothetical protein
MVCKLATTAVEVPRFAASETLRFMQPVARQANISDVGDLVQLRWAWRVVERGEKGDLDPVPPGFRGLDDSPCAVSPALCRRERWLCDRNGVASPSSSGSRACRDGRHFLEPSRAPTSWLSTETAVWANSS